MQAFDYVAAQQVEQAVSLLKQHGEKARVLSGGTDLIVQLAEGRRRATVLVDIKPIAEANQLAYDPRQGLSIGAAVPCSAIARFPAAAFYPGLVDAVSLIGGTQIQNRATVGGNLCNASPAADSLPALIVYEAQCIIAGPAGRREMAVEAFCTGPGRTALQPGEFLLALRLPVPPARSGGSYLRFTPRSEMDIAVVGAGAAVVLADAAVSLNRAATIESARIALGAVAPTPLLVREAGEALRGQKISAAAIEQAAQIAQQAARPISDLRGTSTQRRRLCAVLVRRALERAIERAMTALQKE